jgi:hypothetical protein
MHAYALLLLAALAAPPHTASLHGVVKIADPDGPLPGATITLTSAAHTYTALSDVHGEYSLDGVEAGSYVLRVELKGLTPIEHRLDISAQSASLGVDALKAAHTTCEYEVRSCRDSAPESRASLPDCRDYELETSLIESLRNGDRSAAALLQQRYSVAATDMQRHAIANALLADDSAMWNDLAARAEDAIRFARSANRERSAAAQAFCAEHDCDADEYWSGSLDALLYAIDDPRGRGLIRRALATSDHDLIYCAIAGAAHQRDEDALPAIDATLQRLGDGAADLAQMLALYHSERADAVAMKYLGEEQCAQYQKARDEAQPAP